MNIYKISLILLTQSFASNVFSMQVEQKVEQAAENERGVELITLPAFIQFQLNVKKQTTERLKFYVEQGDLKLKDAALEELHERGLEYSLAAKYVESKPYFEFLIKHGSPKHRAEANFGLGYYFSHVKEDYAQAHTHLVAAEQQNINLWAKAYASLHLGVMYYQGRGVKQDYAKALNCFNFCAEQTNFPQVKVNGLYNLGMLYSRGHGVAQDYAKTRECFNTVIQQDVDDKLKLKSKAEAALKWLDEQEANQVHIKISVRIWYAAHPVPYYMNVTMPTTTTLGRLRATLADTLKNPLPSNHPATGHLQPELFKNGVERCGIPVIKRDDEHEIWHDEDSIEVALSRNKRDPKEMLSFTLTPPNFILNEPK